MASQAHLPLLLTLVFSHFPPIEEDDLQLSIFKGRRGRGHLAEKFPQICASACSLDPVRVWSLQNADLARRSSPWLAGNILGTLGPYSIEGFVFERECEEEFIRTEKV